MPEPERRRRRPFVSCVLCRKRKVRCNREIPCSNCVRSRIENCVYEDHGAHSPRQEHGNSQIVAPRLAQKSRDSDHASSASAGSTVTHYPSSSLFFAGSTAVSTPVTSQPSDQDIESMKRKIRQLEEQLSTVQKKPIQSPNSNIDPVLEQKSVLFGQAHYTNRSILHKGRLFGQSHWSVGVALFMDLFDVIEPHIRGENSKASSSLQRAKYLAKVIKSRRTPPWPTPPTTDLPSKDIADKLVGNYLRTMETVYRILHIPSFKRDYEALWVPGNVPDTVFLIQVKLIMAIGATVYDEHFSLRPSALRWVYEAQTWLSEPEFKSRLNIQALQTNILFLLARELTNVGPTLVWTSAGELYRVVIYMGFHRDPTRLPKRSLFVAEMQRRLWNTLLEVTLQSSINSGGPPLMSPDDYDARPPSNFDDEQLTDDNSVPKNDEDFTQMSVAIALRKTFTVRLAITKFLNDHGSKGTYEEALRLDAELRSSYKAIRGELLKSTSGTGAAPSQFTMQFVDLLMHRYILALHIPFYGRAMRETNYAYTRNVVVETALKVWSTTLPVSAISAAEPLTLARTDMERLTACASGFFRLLAMQACFTIILELRAHLREEESLGPLFVRKDLVSVLRECETWCVRCIKAGETNIKGYLFACMVVAQVEGLMKGYDKNDESKRLVEALDKAQETCLQILEQMAAPYQPDSGTDIPSQMSFDTPPDLMADWDFTLIADQFNFGAMEPMNWAFNDTAMQPSLLS